MADGTTPTSLVGTEVFDISPKEGMKALGYVFGRIGRCIGSGGRRALRMQLERRGTVPPDVVGRTTLKGGFKLVIRGLRGRGTPNAEGTYDTGRRERYEERKPFYPHVRSTRKERREATREAKKAGKRAAKANAHHFRPSQDSPEAIGVEPVG